MHEVNSMVTVRVRIRFRVWLVTGYERVFILLSVVVATLPTDTRHRSDLKVIRNQMQLQRHHI